MSKVLPSSDEHPSLHFAGWTSGLRCELYLFSSLAPGLKPAPPFAVKLQHLETAVQLSLESAIPGALLCRAGAFCADVSSLGWGCIVSNIPKSPRQPTDGRIHQRPRFGQF